MDLGISKEMHLMLKNIYFHKYSTVCNNDEISRLAIAALLSKWDILEEKLTDSAFKKLIREDIYLSSSRVYEKLIALYCLSILSGSSLDSIFKQYKIFSELKSNTYLLEYFCKYIPGRIYKWIFAICEFSLNEKYRYSLRINSKQGTFGDDSTSILYDNDFFRTFGHNAYQPLFIDLDNKLYNYLFNISETLTIHYIKPAVGSIADIHNAYSGNSELIKYTIQYLGHELYELKSAEDIYRVNAYPKDPYSSHALQQFACFANSDYTTHYSRLYFYAQRLGFISSSRKQLSVFDEQEAEFKELLKSLSVKTGSVALIHVRNELFYGDENLRNSDLSNYYDGLKYLSSKGFSLILFSKQRYIPDNLVELVINYPETRLKSKRSDYLLCRFADLLLGTPSGPMCIGDVYGYQSIGVDWWPYAAWPSSKTIVCPKTVFDIRKNKYLSINQFETMANDRGFDLLSPPQEFFRVDKSSSEDIFDACRLFIEGGASIDIKKLSVTGSGQIPASVAYKYNL